MECRRIWIEFNCGSVWVGGEFSNFVIGRLGGGMVDIAMK